MPEPDDSRGKKGYGIIKQRPRGGSLVVEPARVRSRRYRGAEVHSRSASSACEKERSERRRRGQDDFLGHPLHRVSASSKGHKGDVYIPTARTQHEENQFCGGNYVDLGRPQNFSYMPGGGHFDNERENCRLTIPGSAIIGI